MVNINILYLGPIIVGLHLEEKDQYFVKKSYAGYLFKTVCYSELQIIGKTGLWLRPSESKVKVVYKLIKKNTRKRDEIIQFKIYNASQS